ncbi:unnamed protein product [Amaranthus hypochondriacus]
MSRSSQLPPRCPLQKKVGVQQSLEPSLIDSRGIHKSINRHHRSLSQSSLFEEQPAWLDDLLSDSKSTPKGIHHSRSASDSVSLFDGFVPNILSVNNNEGYGNLLESGCIYGPNSPRQRSNVDFLDAHALLALSDSVGQGPAQFVEEIPRSCGTRHFDLEEDYRDASNDLYIEAKTGKRHPGQRSRTRKLQYIAELERTVNGFLTLESELAVRVATLRQQKVVLSLENNKLKKEMARLQQQKLMIDGEYQNLRKEAERLKLGLVNYPRTTSRRHVGSNDSDLTEMLWQTLDWTKLHL